MRRKSPWAVFVAAGCASVALSVFLWGCKEAGKKRRAGAIREKVHAEGPSSRESRDETLPQRRHEAVGHYKRGVAHGEKGDYEAAIEDYTKAVELDHGYALAYYSRGNAYFHRGNYNAAIEDFTKAIELRPADAYARHNRGLAHARKGELEAAIRDYDRAIELKPQLVQAYYNRGRALDSLGHYQWAIEDYTKTIELSPADADVKAFRRLGGKLHPGSLVEPPNASEPGE